MLFAEITRILNHLLNVTTYRAWTSARSRRSLWGFEQRELLMEFYERGQRRAPARGLFPPRRRAPGPAGRHARRHLEPGSSSSPEFIDDIEKLLTENRIFKQRTVDIGVVIREQALDWGFTGPDAARLAACRGTCASRSPTTSTTRMDFDIPVGKTGDCYDRYLVRIEEMRQSRCSIMQPVPRRRCRTGPVQVDDRKVAPPPRGEMKRSMEALIHHFKLYTEGYHVPAGETYTAVEAPKGEFGVYLVSDGTNKPYRCKIRAPGFAASRRRST